MAATPSVKIIKSGSWRGSAKSYSNRYHFTGGTPADSAHWDTLFDAIVTAEKAVYPSGIQITGAVGYAAGSDIPVHSKTYTTNGTATTSGGAAAPLEVAGYLYYTTTQRTVKNHPIYLSNYMRGVLLNAQVTDDPQLLASTKTALQTYGTAWLSGFSDGTFTALRAGPNGAVAQTRGVSLYPVHRDFRK